MDNGPSLKESVLSQATICGVNYEDLLMRMEEFHGYRSPGILLGGSMMDVAARELKPTPYLNVVVETVVCLPDAVQLLSPCTLGNGFLQVLDWGKFALTAYDRMTLSGVRVWLNHDNLPEHPLIYSWFERSKRSEEKPPYEALAEEILNARASLIAYRSVRLHRALKDSERIPTGLCPKCGESYALRLGPACPACQGEAYYLY
jgi:formylmethanofuran dehydrogenase subunit E